MTNLLLHTANQHLEKSFEELKTQDDTKTYIMSLFQEANAPATMS
jgi:hypothetical protein